MTEPHSAPSQSTPNGPAPYFDDLATGASWEFGPVTLNEEEIAAFNAAYAPTIVATEGVRQPAAQSYIYTLWARMVAQFTQDWPIAARIGQDHLRFYKTVFAGDALNVRMTVMARERLDARRGSIVAQHDVVTQSGDLVMSLLSRAVVAAREEDL